MRLEVLEWLEQEILAQRQRAHQELAALRPQLATHFPPQARPEVLGELLQSDVQHSNGRVNGNLLPVERHSRQ